ncbi:helix-turn-helix transcriptional regulator [Devosia rhodophyticola]|uniref:Helix-turn-helix transcriptional regulator n=1 Tax=Devosia rhodophyticola TaxID=3026423 RepID=A0ABY7YXS5_9HYPH|nr:helix-turn-helix transcriptional regulator [Devosia rhodophyticola]WDR06188.1 helix-turn-helix transcriptional regulator [Devosia rhodophyticola]
MEYDVDPRSLVLRDHRFGRFDRRLQIGPMEWPFHDLLWIHEGRARIGFEQLGKYLELAAPNGVLIMQGTRFEGRAIGAFATASICHFEVLAVDGYAQPGPSILLPHKGEELHLQNQIRLALQLARRPDKALLGRRQRLLRSILDGFDVSQDVEEVKDSDEEDRLLLAWDLAARSLGKMRSLSDVAHTLGIRESALRSLHRKIWRTSAGEHLRELRLRKAEELLATTGYSLSEIAKAVGYGHPATLSAAFRKSRGKTPGQYRAWSNPFA